MLFKFLNVKCLTLCWVTYFNLTINYTCLSLCFSLGKLEGNRLHLEFSDLVLTYDRHPVKFVPCSLYKA